MSLRVGLGYDVHRVKAGRPLVLGGVKFESDWGLEGHSDADVLIHAVGDALLGAAGLGDLGEHFPAGDPKWKNASSIDLLQRIVKLLGERGARVENVDVMLVAEAPKLAPHRAAMCANIAERDRHRARSSEREGDDERDAGRYRPPRGPRRVRRGAGGALASAGAGRSAPRASPCRSRR
jgi:2-C-methyl-D-erythritol 2,4-cyclodiphosphate synthase